MNTLTRLGLPLLVVAPMVLFTAPARAQEDAAAKPPQAERESAPAASEAAGADGGKEAEKDAAASRPDDFDRTPEDCVQLTSIRQTKIVDDRTILFYMRSGGKIYRNSLPRECPELAREDRFSYKTSMSRLCNVDLITVLQQFGPDLRDGFTCKLGNFIPISREEAEDLLLAKDDLGRTRNGIKSKPAKVPDEKKDSAAEAPKPAEDAPR